MNTYKCKKVLVSGLVASLALLPGCGIFNRDVSTDEVASPSAAQMESADNKPLTGDVIVTMNGKPIITSDVIAFEKENVMKSKPELRAALAFMDPKILDKNIAEGLISQAVIDQYAKEQGFENSTQYQTELADIMKNMKRVLNAKFFSQQFKVVVTDNEIVKFYEENKKLFPELVISQGGIVASGIEFSSQKLANEFAAKVRAANNNFARAAQQENLTSSIKDFKVVNAQSMDLDPVLRDKIVAITTVPSLHVIEANNGVWVVSATKKEEPKYVPLEQIKANIKQRLENTKLNELFESEIAQLRTKYNVIFNEDYFKLSPSMDEMSLQSEMMRDASSEVAQNDHGKKETVKNLA